MKGQSRTSALALLLVYVGVVHTIDTLAAWGVTFLVDWRAFAWQTSSGFDLFKFCAWFVVPFLFCLPGMDWGYFGVKRWHRRDAHILAGLAVVGALAILTTRFVPSLKAVYGGWSGLPWDARWSLAQRSVVWTASWLIGWEFLHRYALLTKLNAVWPRYGWLVVPVIEGLYHLQKPLPEAAGMVVFGLFLTAWARTRRNVLLPFLAHALVELELILFLLLT